MLSGLSLGIPFPESDIFTSTYGRASWRVLTVKVCGPGSSSIASMPVHHQVHDHMPQMDGVAAHLQHIRRSTMRNTTPFYLSGLGWPGHRRHNKQPSARSLG